MPEPLARAALARGNRRCHPLGLLITPISGSDAHYARVSVVLFGVALGRASALIADEIYE